jgi:hypothetical protein
MNMLHIKIGPTGLPLDVKTALNEFEHRDPTWQSRWDWKTFEEVERLARYLTAMKGTLYIPIDNTDAVSPRYDIIECPKVGDPVSYGFNGDYYPDGHIVKITKTLQITTSTGHTYRRKGLRACWLQPGGTWGLVAGHRYEQNPSF